MVDEKITFGSVADEKKRDDAYPLDEHEDGSALDAVIKLARNPESKPILNAIAAEALQRCGESEQLPGTVEVLAEALAPELVELCKRLWMEALALASLQPDSHENQQVLGELIGATISSASDAEKHWSDARNFTLVLAVARQNFSRTDDHFERDGMFWADWCALSRLSSTGQSGERMVSKLRERCQERWRENGSKALERWSLWFQFGSPLPVSIAILLGMALWSDRVGFKRKRVALIATEAAPSLIGAFLSRDRRQEEANGQFELYDSRGVKRASFRGAPELPESILDKSWLAATSTVSAQSLLRWVPLRALESIDQRSYQTGLSGLPLHKVTIEVPGAIDGLRRTLGLASKRASDELETALDAGQHIVLYVGDAEFHGLWTYSVTYVATAKGRMGLLRIDPGDALLPTGLYKIPSGHGKAFPLPHALPPLHGNRKTWNAQATMQLWAMVYLRDHACELVERGDVLIPDSAWRQWADASGLESKLIPGVREWQASDRTGPGGGDAFLMTENGTRWTLGPKYHLEMERLRQGAEISKKRQRMGRKRGRRLKES